MYKATDSLRQRLSPR